MIRERTRISSQNNKNKRENKLYLRLKQSNRSSTAHITIKHNFNEQRFILVQQTSRSLSLSLFFSPPVSDRVFFLLTTFFIVWSLTKSVFSAVLIVVCGTLQCSFMNANRFILCSGYQETFCLFRLNSPSDNIGIEKSVEIETRNMARNTKHN